MKCVEEVSVSPGQGLSSDRYQGRSGRRQVTLIQAEHLSAIGSWVGRNSVSPELLRRNLVIRGINLLALKDKVIAVGGVELEITGLCHPCSRMEEVLGPGGYNAMRGHGGLTAHILTAGRIVVGDPVRYPQTTHSKE
ncbi:MAG: MOSC domain-containing protein [Gammaproteobacteria bacterium]|nr:MOSC domain-containing protein [Gammaproteobacteria bacterium]